MYYKVIANSKLIIAVDPAQRYSHCISHAMYKFRERFQNQMLITQNLDMETLPLITIQGSGLSLEYRAQELRTFAAGQDLLVLGARIQDALQL